MKNSPRKGTRDDCAVAVTSNTGNKKRTERTNNMVNVLFWQNRLRERGQGVSVREPIMLQSCSSRVRKSTREVSSFADYVNWLCAARGCTYHIDAKAYLRAHGEKKAMHQRSSNTSVSQKTIVHYPSGI